MSVLSFFKASSAIPLKDYTEKMFRSTRMKNFWAFSFAYAIYYVCRLSFNVAKPALVNNGILSATELGFRNLYYLCGREIREQCVGGSFQHRSFLFRRLVLFRACQFRHGHEHQRHCVDHYLGIQRLGAIHGGGTLRRGVIPLV